MGSEEFVVTIPMPFTGESIVDGVLVNWLVEPGEPVEKGQHIAEIETEKSVWEFESPCDGEIVSLKAEPGDVVDVQAPLLEIRTADENVKHLLTENAQAAERARRNDGGPADQPSAEKEVSEPGSDRINMSPRAKRRMRELGLDEQAARTMAGTGPQGRVTVEDIDAFAEAAPGQSLEAAAETTCYIAGIGAYAPERVVTNSTFTEHFDDVNEAYIEKVTGIRERRWVDGETTSDMATRASERALASAGMTAQDLDMIILATTTADMPLPAAACAVQKQLGCTKIPAFDLQAACSGWLYGLSVAREFIRSGTYKNVLVVASETMSRFTDHTDRATAFLFGDGAGAAVVSSNHIGHVLSDIVLAADSSGYDIIYRRAGGASMPPRFMDSPKDEYWYMDGGMMFRSAVAAFTDVIQAVAEKAKTAVKDFAWFVPHQANRRILKTVAGRVKALPERFFFNIEKYGNTSSASIPLALKDLEREDKVAAGDRVLLCSVGAGLTSAGCVLTWR